jgi:dipicolinate synthase subunit A
MGYKAVNFDEFNGLGDFNYCFNTVPAMVLTEELLKEFSSDIVIIDIASRPGGTDFSCCDRLGITHRHSLGIPGRYSPDTSGKILAEAFIKKEGK